MSAPASRRAILSSLTALPVLTVTASAAATGNPELLRLVVSHEEVERHLREQSDRLDQVGVPYDDAWRSAVKVCGRYRAEIAVFPVSCLADILLKVRAYAVSRSLEDEEEEVRCHFEEGDGHAYDTDVAQGVMIDLMRMGGFGECA